MSTLLAALRLIRTPNVGPITYHNLISYYGSAAKALEALPELAKRGGRKQPLVAYSRNDAEKEITATEKFGAKMIAHGDADYPKLLMNIPDAPPILCVLGNAHLWQQKPLVAMVGARNASAAGCQLAQKIARDLGDAGYIVVSGLARGIDAFVHKGALTSGTIGVIAGGIDTIYPPENQMLYMQMREQGAIISEQPFGQAPFAGSFPSRNRIIAGMTLGTVVVEASPKSGSLITARLAGEYNREVFAIPGSPLDPRSRGCNGLIKQGATMVEDATDIIRGVSHLRNLSLAETNPPVYAAATSTSSESELATARTKIMEKLSLTAVSVDELIEQCGISTAAALGALLELELAGKVRRTAGNKMGLVVADFGEGAA
jgi:DNA processing protein